MSSCNELNKRINLLVKLNNLRRYGHNVEFSTNDSNEHLEFLSNSFNAKIKKRNILITIKDIILISIEIIGSDIFNSIINKLIDENIFSKTVSKLEFSEGFAILYYNKEFENKELTNSELKFINIVLNKISNL